MKALLFILTIALPLLTLAAPVDQYLAEQDQAAAELTGVYTGTMKNQDGDITQIFLEITPLNQIHTNMCKNETTVTTTVVGRFGLVKNSQHNAMMSFAQSIVAPQQHRVQMWSSAFSGGETPAVVWPGMDLEYKDGHLRGKFFNKTLITDIELSKVRS